MRRLAIACGASLLIYAVLFAAVLDRPVTLGALQARIEANLARGALVRGPKLVILAGSNGPYSHRCEIIEALVNRPCVNAGIAVGVGLDYLFARWQPLLHAGDIVYLPLEEAQYARSRAVAELGPDAAIMLRHDRRTLARMPASRQIAALFSSDLRGAVMSMIETALVLSRFNDPRAAMTGVYNAWGDHVGHTAGVGAGNQRVLSEFVPYHPVGRQISEGYGTRIVRDFIAWAIPRGIHVVGGLPTGFIDSPIDPRARVAIEAVYRGEGAGFLLLPNASRYRRADFFDTADHLNEAAQIRHSVAVANGLLTMIRPNPPAAITALTPLPIP